MKSIKRFRLSRQALKQSKRTGSSGSGDDDFPLGPRIFSRSKNRESKPENTLRIEERTQSIEETTEAYAGDEAGAGAEALKILTTDELAKLGSDVPSGSAGMQAGMQGGDSPGEVREVQMQRPLDTAVIIEPAPERAEFEHEAVYVLGDQPQGLEGPYGPGDRPEEATEESHGEPQRAEDGPPVSMPLVAPNHPNRAADAAAPDPGGRPGAGERRSDGAPRPSEPPAEPQAGPPVSEPASQNADADDSPAQKLSRYAVKAGGHSYFLVDDEGHLVKQGRRGKSR